MSDREKSNTPSDKMEILAAVSWPQSEISLIYQNKSLFESSFWLQSLFLSI